MPARSPSPGRAAAKAPRKPTLSPTRIGTYLECALKYRYIYLDKIGRFYTRARAGYSFGSTLHHVLQQFHESGGVQSDTDLVAALDRSWIAAGYESLEQEAEHRRTGAHILTGYRELHTARTGEQIETLFTEKTITCDLGSFRLTGRVDRIDRHQDGTLEIVDYKSGRLETSAEEVANSLAMSCYQLILSRLYPATPILATIYCLRSGEQASASMSGQQLTDFERDIVALGVEMLNSDLSELTPVLKDACQFCDFLPRCQRYWNEQRAIDSDWIADSQFADEP